MGGEKRELIWYWLTGVVAITSEIYLKSKSSHSIPGSQTRHTCISSFHSFFEITKKRGCAEITLLRFIIL